MQDFIEPFLWLCVMFMSILLIVKIRRLQKKLKGDPPFIWIINDKGDGKNIEIEEIKCDGKGKIG